MLWRMVCRDLPCPNHRQSMCAGCHALADGLQRLALPKPPPKHVNAGCHALADGLQRLALPKPPPKHVRRVPCFGGWFAETCPAETTAKACERRVPCFGGWFAETCPAETTAKACAPGAMLWRMVCRDLP